MTEKPITLGELIRQLEAAAHGEEHWDGRDGNGKNKFTTARWIEWEFGGLLPAGVDSYRGIYSDLAIGFENHSERARRTGKYESCYVPELLNVLKASVGQIFFGWKGGEYEMTEDTVVWAANRGDATRTAVVGTRVIDSTCFLLTEHLPI